MEAIVETSFPFLRLPLELQNHVLGYLLPNEKAIGLPSGQQVEYAKKYPYCCEAVKFRSGNEKCFPAILRVNRQISEQGHYIAYNRSFIISLTEHRNCDFLRSRGRFGDFPFDKAKQIQIDIHFDSDPVILWDLLWSTDTVTKYLASYSLRSLKINCFEENTQVSPVMISGLSRVGEQVKLDLELILQAFKRLKNVGMCEISLLPQPMREPLNPEQDN